MSKSEMQKTIIQAALLKKLKLFHENGRLDYLQFSFFTIKINEIFRIENIGHLLYKLEELIEERPEIKDLSPQVQLSKTRLLTQKYHE